MNFLFQLIVLSPILSMKRGMFRIPHIQIRTILFRVPCRPEAISLGEVLSPLTAQVLRLLQMG